MKPPAPRLSAEEHIRTVRQICLSLPGTSEKLSHGEPTFFVAKKVFTMVADNHHGDGRIAIWIPAPPGLQKILIDAHPETYFKPPYVGVRGWIGIELTAISNADLAHHILAAWQLIAPKKLQSQRRL